MSSAQIIPVRIENKRIIELQNQKIPVQKSTKTFFGFTHEIERSGNREKIRHFTESEGIEKKLQEKTWKTFVHRFGIPKRFGAQNIRLSSGKDIPFSLYIDILAECWETLPEREKSGLRLIPIHPMPGPAQFHFYSEMYHAIEKELKEFLPRISYFYEAKTRTVFEIVREKPSRYRTLAEFFQNASTMSSEEKGDIIKNIMAWREAVMSLAQKTGYIPNAGIFTGSLLRSESISMSEEGRVIMHEIFPLLPLACFNEKQHNHEQFCVEKKEMKQSNSIFQTFWRKNNFFDVWFSDFHSISHLL